MSHCLPSAVNVQMRVLSSSRISSPSGCVAARALVFAVQMSAANTNAGTIVRRVMLESVNRADKGCCNEALLQNRAIGDRVPQSLVLGECAETPFALQREGIPQLEKRIQSRSRLINARGPVIIIDDRRAFPRDADVGGQRSLRLQQGDPQRRAYFR